MATRAPTGALNKASAMIMLRTSSGVGIDHAGRNTRQTSGAVCRRYLRRCLKVAAQAEVGVASDEHLLVDGAVGIMARSATFLHGSVLVDERSLLSGMTLGAGVGLIGQINAATLDGVTFMNIMAIHATNLAGEHRMAMRQAELAAFIEMARKAGFRILVRIDDIAATTAGLHVQACRTMAGLATRGADLGIGDRKLSVTGRLKMVGLVGVTLHTFLGSDVGRAWYFGGREDSAINAHASDKHQSP